MHLAHCPERVLPGRIMIEIATNDRVIGGLTPACAARAAGLYRTFCHGELLITDAASAEMAKLAENAYRDVNIAYANELSLICQQLGLDVWEIRQLANHHPRVDILRPGPGVGGHCIAVDPWFIVDAAPEQATLIAAARGINDQMPGRTAAQIVAASRRFREPRIACLGLSFKADVEDLRGSPAVAIVAQVAAELPGNKVSPSSRTPRRSRPSSTRSATSSSPTPRRPARCGHRRAAHRSLVLPLHPAHGAGGQGRLRHPRPVGLMPTQHAATSSGCRVCTPLGLRCRG